MRRSARARFDSRDRRKSRLTPNRSNRVRMTSSSQGRRVLFTTSPGDSSLTRLREQIFDRRTQMTYSSTKLTFIAVAIAGMLTASIQAARAEDPPPPPAAAAPSAAPRMKVACGPDLASFCPDMKGKEAGKCLRSHRAELSDSCKAFFKARRAAAKAKATAAPAAAPAQQ